MHIGAIIYDNRNRNIKIDSKPSWLDYIFIGSDYSYNNMKKEKYKIQIITKVPNPDKDDGNLAHDTLIKGIDQGHTCYFPYNDHDRKGERITIMSEVFALGEIIIVDAEIGREIGGIQRKADKWFVEYKEFDMKDINKAIKLSKKLSKTFT